jgi:hypothetical protein
MSISEVRVVCTGHFLRYRASESVGARSCFHAVRHRVRCDQASGPSSRTRRSHPRGSSSAVGSRSLTAEAPGCDWRRATSWRYTLRARWMRRSLGTGPLSIPPRRHGSSATSRCPPTVTPGRSPRRPHGRPRPWRSIRLSSRPCASLVFKLLQQAGRSGAGNSRKPHRHAGLAPGGLLALLDPVCARRTSVQS